MQVTINRKKDGSKEEHALISLNTVAWLISSRITSENEQDKDWVIEQLRSVLKQIKEQGSFEAIKSKCGDIDANTYSRYGLNLSHLFQILIDRDGVTVDQEVIAQFVDCLEAKDLQQWYANEGPTPVFALKNKPQNSRIHTALMNNPEALKIWVSLFLPTPAADQTIKNKQLSGNFDLKNLVGVTLEKNLVLQFKEPFSVAQLQNIYDRVREIRGNSVLNFFGGFKRESGSVMKQLRAAESDKDAIAIFQARAKTHPNGASALMLRHFLDGKTVQPTQHARPRTQSLSARSLDSQ